jgi:beta-lactam-binding protein with PASTA domain
MPLIVNIPHYSWPLRPQRTNVPTILKIRMPETGNPPSGTLIVPLLLGLTQSAAAASLVTTGFVDGTVLVVQADGTPGLVFYQSPTVGTLRPALSAVDYSVSLGREVPQLVNTSLTPVATALVAAAHLVIGSVTFAESVLINKGNIISQSPAGGTFVAGGTAVNVVVSTGRSGLFVPYLFELSPVAANLTLTNLGLTVGAVSYAPSLSVPAGEVMAQNPQGGTPVAYGSLVSYIVSLGIPAAKPTFDFEATVISQYANSPTILQLVRSMNGYIDQSQNFANFYNFLWNVDTAQGFGLDVWGKIVNVSRLLQIPTSNRYVGFQDGSGPGPSTDVEPFSANGAWFTALSATEAYLLEDAPYRQLILTKALANIVNTTVPAFNQLLQNLFPGRGNPYVTTTGPMAMNFQFDFDLTPVELAILQQSGAVPVPPGVSFTLTQP